MPRPRVRFDERGEPLPCKVFVPAHLAKILYREARKARKGGGTAGQPVEETDIVIRLIERWAETLDPVDWPKLLEELKAEADAEAEAEKKKPKKKPKK